jgi:hypothetical protein
MDELTIDEVAECSGQGPLANCPILESIETMEVRT